MSTLTLPDIPALFVAAREGFLLSTDGELQTLSHEDTCTALATQSALVCHAPFTRGRLNFKALHCFDVLELFAFVHPAKFCVSTPHGLAKALGLEEPQEAEDYPLALMDIARALLEDLRKDKLKDRADPLVIAHMMGFNGKGWSWTPFVCAALGQSYDPKAQLPPRSAFKLWKKLPEWAEEAPPPPPAHDGVNAQETDARLQKMLGPEAEQRDAQKDYAREVANIFAPLEGKIEEAPAPHLLLAEAGTGVGKTLGYLAPASVWAEKNQGTVWISTYTKNLQRQIDQELDRLYPDEELKNTHVAVRKGRENYMCLLNLEDAQRAVPTARNPANVIATGLMIRWAAGTKDGDLSGTDFPGWLAGLLGPRTTYGLADRRGECVYAACDHYSRCYIEHSVRKAERARLVVANHALAMISTAMATPGDTMPSRYIFDEGHHLFDAADSAFAAHLTARETRDLRRWLLGGEGGRSGQNSRARGIKRRAEDLTEGDAEAEKLLHAITHEAQCLTSDGWTTRLSEGGTSGPCEAFLALLYAQTYARAEGREGPYSLEIPAHPAGAELIEKAQKLKKALHALCTPMKKLANIFRKKLAEDKGAMSGDTRKRLDALAGSLDRRSLNVIEPWISMLEGLEQGATPDLFVDWMDITRIDGRVMDVGLNRHYVDPMKPLAAALAPHAQGVLVTSATLRDHTQGEDGGWPQAGKRTGAAYLNPAYSKKAVDSPFDYKTSTKVFIAEDVRKTDTAQVAGATQALFEASGGGALGLFTAIQRLRAVHAHIAGPLEDAGLPLYAQHVDEIDPGTLVDMFRDDTHACLLGTDAIRDGVDVPGESLRLIAFDRVPWTRPTILHKARRNDWAQGRAYDEMITRMKIRQAFGRLIRRSSDKGVFVMLDQAFPSRLHNAFPEGVEVQKASLQEIVEEVRGFLTTDERRSTQI